MKDNRNTKAQKAEPKTPTYQAYAVRDGKPGSKAFWTRIGAFFAHEDGEGGTLVLEAMPLDGRVVLRAPKTGDDE